MAIVVFEHSDLAGSDRLGEKLRDYGHKLNVVQLHRDEPVPVDLDNVDGVVTCGGEQSIVDETPGWLNAQMAFLREAVGADLPVVGLCLGSQILAKALGGEIAKLESGIELGWHEVQLTDTGRDDIIHQGIGWTTTQFHWHRDHMTELPPDARLIASSARCHVQAWSCGLRTYGFQHHPEVDRDTIGLWADDEPEALAEAGIARDELDKQTEQHWAEFWRITDRLFENIALLLMPVDRRYHGVAKDLHH